MAAGALSFFPGRLSPPRRARRPRRRRAHRLVGCAASPPVCWPWRGQQLPAIRTPAVLSASFLSGSAQPASARSQAAPTSCTSPCWVRCLAASLLALAGSSCQPFGRRRCSALRNGLALRFGLFHRQRRSEGGIPASGGAMRQRLARRVPFRLAPRRRRGAQIGTGRWRGRTMLLKTLAALLALGLGAVATSTVAIGKERGRNHTREHDANWVLIATRSLDLKKEGDRFEVGVSKGRFKAVRLVGLDRRIEINRVAVTADGEPYIETPRVKLERGQGSPAIRFSHEGKVVEHVDVSYRLHLGAAGPAKVELWGLRASPEVLEVHSASPRWVWIGTRSVDLKKEEDRIEVGAGKGRFKSVMLVGVDRLIDITRITVVTDGTPHVEKRRLKLQHGQRSRPITFSRGEGQVVRQVDLAYRLHLGAGGPANVELWGLRAASGQAVAVAQPAPGGIATGAAPAVAGPVMDATDGDGAVLFGVQEVGAGGDRDVFKLGREYGQFARLRLRALGAAVPVKEMHVIYAGGEPDVLAVNAELAADQRTGWLELKGDRCIRELQFVYPSQARRGKARLEVYGEYAESWFQPGSGTGAFASANDGWLYLGGQSPLFLSIRRGLGYETDVVSVARNRGFRSLRLDVKNRAITLNRIKVIYADGSSEVFAERQRVAGGTSFGPVELKAELPVKQIEISHRSRFFDSQAEGSGYAFVEFWAR